MKHIRLLLFPVVCLLLVECKPSTDQSKHLNAVANSDSLKQIDERIRLDFSLSEEKAIEAIKERTGQYPDVDKSFWEENGWLEWRLIDGKKMYFNRAVSNLFLIKNFYEEKEKRLLEIAADPEMVLRKKHTEEILKASEKNRDPVIPLQMKITYTITVLPDAVPEGETIRCWMPFPKEGHQRQKNPVLLNTSQKDYVISPDSAIHRTLYMENKTSKGMPTVFESTFTYLSTGLYFNPDKEKILPYDKSTEIYKKYTSEQLPHICFTNNIKRLADTITSPGDLPAETVRKIYLWFKENIPWTGALEYSIMPNIPEYVYLNRRGDCGMQTFLFMSMLRYKGIPVRWQSGWKVPPGNKNLHDWCEVYYEGVGWVPADVSYDLQTSDLKEVKEFFISGIDSYRMIVNDGISGPLYPAKKFMRSEPFDFQRGEVEWSGGNLYFDKWDYEMKIEYIK